MTALHGGTDDVDAMRNMLRNDDHWEKPKYVSRSAAKPLHTTSRLSERLLEKPTASGQLGSDSDTT